MSILEVLGRGMSVYCESGVGLFSTQPINTISNIAILVFAYFSYQLVKTHNIKNPIIRILPVVAAIIGIGSILWHGAPNLLTSFADTVPLSIFVLISFFFLLSKLLQNRILVWGTLFVFMLIEFPFIFGILPSFNGFIPYFIALIFGLFLFFGLARKYKNLLPQLLPIIPLFLIAFLFRTIDLTICPTFQIGTHFLWHIFNALMFYLFIRFFVEMEREKVRKQ